MIRDRQWRRWMLERKKKRAAHYWYMSDGDPRRIGMAARTPMSCSCYMCGNPRKYRGGLTMQERRAL